MAQRWKNTELEDWLRWFSTDERLTGSVGDDPNESRILDCPFNIYNRRQCRNESSLYLNSVLWNRCYFMFGEQSLLMNDKISGIVVGKLPPPPEGLISCQGSGLGGGNLPSIFPVCQLRSNGAFFFFFFRKCLLSGCNLLIHPWIDIDRLLNNW